MSKLRYALLAVALGLPAAVFAAFSATPAAAGPGTPLALSHTCAITCPDGSSGSTVCQDDERCEAYCRQIGTTGEYEALVRCLPR